MGAQLNFPQKGPGNNFRHRRHCQTGLVTAALKAEFMLFLQFDAVARTYKKRVITKKLAIGCLAANGLLTHK